MALIFILLTQLTNQTTFTIDFEVARRRGLLPELRGGKNRFTKQSRVLRWLREYDPGWKIGVLVDGHFTGVELDPQIILMYVRVVFRVERGVLCVDGVRENRRSDFVLRQRYFGCMRNLYWNRRVPELIDRSDSKLATKLRNIEGRHGAPFVDITSQKSPEEKSLFQQDTRPLKPSVEIKENNTKNIQPNGTSTPQQVTERDDIKNIKPNGTSTPQPARERDGIKNMQPNGTSTPQPARERDDHPRPLDLRSPTRIGEHDVTNMQPNGTSASQHPRPRDDQSFTNVVDKDSFVHGFLIIFSLTFCMFLKFLF